MYNLHAPLNYLAHAWLSGGSSMMTAANVLGDHVKGRAFLDYPEEFAAGLLLHRRIDHWTDTHPAASEALVLLRPELGRVSGIAMDILMDHVLATRFQEFSQGPDLQELIVHTYRSLQAHEELYTPRMLTLSRRMRQTDWLNSYSDLGNLEEIFHRLSMRISWENSLTRAVEAFQANREELEELSTRMLTDVCKKVQGFDAKAALLSY